MKIIKRKKKIQSKFVVQNSNKGLIIAKNNLASKISLSLISDNTESMPITVVIILYTLFQVWSIAYLPITAIDLILSMIGSFGATLIICEIILHMAGKYIAKNTIDCELPLRVKNTMWCGPNPENYSGNPHNFDSFVKTAIEYNKNKSKENEEACIMTYLLLETAHKMHIEQLHNQMMENIGEEEKKKLDSFDKYIEGSL